MIVMILKWFLVSWVLSSWAMVATELMEPSQSRWKLVRFLISMLQYVMSCPKCFSFWTILGLSGDFFIAAGVSLLVNIYFKLEQKIKTEL